MFSQELYIMDKNTERLMVEELQDEVNALKTSNNALTAEKQALADKLQVLRKALADAGIDVPDGV